jgi:acetyltransferase-like isoleucine patch superfamily enzyme
MLFQSQVLSLNNVLIHKFTIIDCTGVLIGTRAVILGGVVIGRNSIVAAGSVVNKDVPAFAIMAGVHAKGIRYRKEA